jgi:hypothetical protein
MQLQLEREQEDLFMELVEATRNVPRAERQPFHLVRTMGGSLIHGNGYRVRVLEEDLLTLQSVGLIQVTRHAQHGFSFFIPPPALQYYEELKASLGEPMEQVEDEVLRYLDGASFQQKYPVAFALWKDATALLWHADSARELSTIGHKCRETVQEFLTALIDRFQVRDAPPDKARTRERFSAVLAARRGELGEVRAKLLDALFNYWRAVGDLVQRQEHAGQREGEPLIWEDARRVVFQTALVMVEIDRTI